MDKALLINFLETTEEELKEVYDLVKKGVTVAEIESAEIKTAMDQLNKVIKKVDALGDSLT